MPTPHIGRSVPRKEGREKVTGAARYVDDLSFPGMLYGATVRSPAARGRIVAIHLDPRIPWNEFTVVTARDIPGKNHVELILQDQPCLAGAHVNHPEEAVVLLAHPDKYLLEDARRAVRIEIEPAPAVFSIEDSLARKAIIWGTDNIFKSYLVSKGNVAEVFARSDVVITEGEYHTGAQEQLYIEPQGVIATASAQQGVTVWGSMQCPYYVHKALVPIFGLPKERGIPLHDRGPRRAAGAEIGQAGKDHLRPRGRYGRHHQAPPLAHAHPQRRHPRRPAPRSRH
jgi:CO/xanthine dehydrogenase Mo-binding subunit